MKDRREMVLGDLGILLCALLWGCSFWGLKVVQEYIPVFWILTLRFGLSFGAMALLMPSKLRLRWGDLVLGGLLGLALASAIAMQILGVAWTTTGKVAFLTAGYVVLVPFLTWALDKRAPALRVFLAAFLCLGGMAALSLESGLRIHRGEAAAIGAAVLSAAHLILVDRLGPRRNPLKLALAQFAMAALFCGSAALVLEPLPTVWPPKALGAMAYLVLFCTLIPYAIQLRAQQMTLASHAAVIFATESVFAVAVGWAFLREPFSFRMASGCVLILVSILITELDLSPSSERR